MLRAVACGAARSACRWVWGARCVPVDKGGCRRGRRGALFFAHAATCAGRPVPLQRDGGTGQPPLRARLPRHRGSCPFTLCTVPLPPHPPPLFPTRAHRRRDSRDKVATAGGLPPPPAATTPAATHRRRCRRRDVHTTLGRGGGRRRSTGTRPPPPHPPPAPPSAMPPAVAAVVAGGAHARAVPPIPVAPQSPPRPPPPTPPAAGTDVALAGRRAARRRARCPETVG